MILIDVFLIVALALFVVTGWNALRGEACACGGLQDPCPCWIRRVERWVSRLGQ